MLYQFPQLYSFYMKIVSYATSDQPEIVVSLAKVSNAFVKLLGKKTKCVLETLAGACFFFSASSGVDCFSLCYICGVRLEHVVCVLS